MERDNPPVFTPPLIADGVTDLSQKILWWDLFIRGGLSQTGRPCDVLAWLRDVDRCLEAEAKIASALG